MKLRSNGKSLAPVEQAISEINRNLETVNEVSQAIVIRGTATDGSNGYLEDTTKNWTIDEHIGRVIRIDINGTLHYPVITANTANRVYFPPIIPPTNSRATIGSGAEGEGKLVITRIGSGAGALGNLDSVKIVHGNTNTGEIHASYSNNLLTITVDTNGLGEQQTLAGGNVEGILATAGLGAEFFVPSTPGDDWVAGNLPVDGVEIDFAGGADGLQVSAGDAYEIAYSIALENLSGQVTALAQANSELAYQSTVAVAENKTLALTDIGTMQKVTAAATLTIPKNSDVAFPVNTAIDIVSYTTSNVIIAPDTDVTLRSVSSYRKISAQYAAATLKKLAADEWILVGSLKS